MKSFRVAAVAAAVVLVAQGVAIAAEPLRVTEPVHVTTGDVVPTRTYSSPFLLVDPGNRLNVVAGFVDMRSRRCGLMRSTDGGQRWKLLDSSPQLPSYPFCFHTSGGVVQTPLAFGQDSTLYMGLVGWDAQEGNRGNHSVLVARSTDLGDTWEVTVAHDARGKEGADIENNRPVSRIVVDTSGDQDVVYVAWRGNWPGATPSRASRPMVAVSTDGGRSFSQPIDAAAKFFEPQQVRDEALRSAPEPTPPATPPATPPPARDLVTNFGGGNPQVAVDHEGTLYVLFVRATSNLTPPPDQPMYVARSTDRGKTFTVHEVSPASNFHGGPILAWTPQGGDRGTLHVVYEDKPGQTQGDRDIFHRRSTDGGTTWSEAKILHDDDPKQLIGQFIPNMSVAPNGRVDVVWWDFRNDPGTYVNDVYYTYSTDNGQSWNKNIRLTDRSINRRIGPWSNNFDMRQPPGIASTDAFAIAGWDDTRHGDEAGQAQDIYSAAVQFRPLVSGQSNALRYAMAAFGGLVVVGLILLITASTTRRRMEPPPARESIPDREPVKVS